MLPSCSAVGRPKYSSLGSLEISLESLCQAAAPPRWVHDMPDRMQAAAYNCDSSLTCKSYTDLAPAGVSERHHHGMTRRHPIQGHNAPWHPRHQPASLDAVFPNSLNKTCSISSMHRQASVHPSSTQPDT